MTGVSVPEESPTVVIGNFDGVHRGHQALVQQAKKLDPDGHVVVVTFWPHPLTVLAPDQAPALLCPLERRIDWLTEAGASEVRVVNFTPEIAKWSPADFVERMITPLQPEHVLVGQNFRFGRHADPLMLNAPPPGSRAPGGGVCPLALTEGGGPHGEGSRFTEW